ncbi:MAG TPA: hypothetical protein VEM41_13655 [Actinomycetota bacterium]|nr:hypothetical protein [Actinomycetota bacterium]
MRQVGSSDKALDVRAGDPGAPGSRGRETGRPLSSTWDLGRTAAAVLLVCLVGGLIAGFYLEIYRSGNVRTPAGYDTARYLGQAAMVAHGGLASVAKVHLPPPGPPHTSRVAFPVLDLSFARLLGRSTFFFAALLPTAGIVAMALAAGAFVSFALRRGLWTFAVVAIVVGTSTCAARLFLPETYQDNIVSGALFVAALVPLLSFLRGGKGWLPAALLLALVAMTHTGFYAFDIGVLCLMGLALLPASLRAVRGGERLRATPVARLVLVIAISIAIPAFVVVAFLHGKVDVPSETLEVLRQKLRADLSLYRWAITLPVALIGVWGVLGDARGRPVDGGPAVTAHPPSSDETANANGDASASEAASRASGARFVLLLSAAWLVAILVGWLIFLAGKAIPMHRLLAFFLPLPILGALGVLTLGGIVSARWARAAGAVVVAVGVCGFVFIGYQSLYPDLAHTRGVAPMHADEVQQAATAERYLDAMKVAPASPVVFVTNDWGSDPSSSIQLEGFVARTVVAPARLPTTFFYVGDPQQLLAGRPTIEPNDTRGFNDVSRAYWPAVARVLPDHPVEIMLAAFNRKNFEGYAQAFPSKVVAPGVLVLSGPRPAAPIPPAPLPAIPRGSVQLLVFGAGTLVILGLVGLGWALALLPRSTRPVETFALSVAFGIAALIAVGTALDLAGLRLGGEGGHLAVPIAAVAGWALAAFHLTRERSARKPDPNEVVSL